MKMKKFRTIALALLSLGLFSIFLAGGPTPAKAADGGSGKISVVCTTFPQYDWVRQILGEKADGVELTLLLDSGVDLHSFQPTADDMIQIAACDLFIYVGGESDEWVADALKETARPERVVISLLETLGAGARPEEIVEGMEEEAEEEAHEGEEALDEHVWLSPRNAGIFCSAIADALSSIDAGGAETYRRNLAAYREKLSALDTDYRAAVGAAPVKTLLFGDRFPFRYLADDYGLTYYAAFPGCSAETEASFETIVFLSNKVDEVGLKTVMALEGSDQAIARTIVSGTKDKDQRILTLDSMQSVTAGDVEKGASYLSIMTGNLAVLKEALR